MYLSCVKLAAGERRIEGVRWTKGGWGGRGSRGTWKDDMEGGGGRSGEGTEEEEEGGQGGRDGERR